MVRLGLIRWVTEEEREEIDGRDLLKQTNT